MGSDIVSRMGRSGYREGGGGGEKATSLTTLMHRKQIDGTFMLRRCGKKTAKAQAKAGSFGQSQRTGQGKNTSPQYELWTPLGCRLRG